MRRWADRNRLFHRIDADVGFRQLADERQTFQQLFLAQVTQVEVNHVATRCGDGVAFAPLVPESLRDFVARAEFHVLVLRLAERGFRAHAVILQVAVAVFVDQDTAFTAAAFRHQNAGARQTGWVILHELHIAQRHAVAERHTHTVAGNDAAVGVITINAARTARRHHHRIGADLDERAFHHVHRHQAARVPIIHQNVEDEMLIKALDLWELKGGLEQGVQHVEAGLIGGEPGTFDLHAAEATNVDAAVRTTTPRTSPLFKLGHLRWTMVHKVVNDILFAKPVAPCNRVVEMVFKAVMILRNGGGSSFCGHRVAAHWIDF